MNREPLRRFGGSTSNRLSPITVLATNEPLVLMRFEPGTRIGRTGGFRTGGSFSTIAKVVDSILKVDESDETGEKEVQVQLEESISAYRPRTISAYQPPCTEPGNRFKEV